MQGATADAMVRETLRGSEIKRAREWWDQLPSIYRGRCSIWMLLAMYAHYVETGAVASEPAAKRDE